MIREKMFTVYEKPEASEPDDRIVLVREGFSLWAFVFGAVWLFANRQWRVLVGFLFAAILLRVVCQSLQLSLISSGLLELWLQLMLGFHAYDWMGRSLKRRGYRFAGVLAAESEMHAQRRYDEFAA